MIHILLLSNIFKNCKCNVNTGIGTGKYQKLKYRYRPILGKSGIGIPIHKSCDGLDIVTSDGSWSHWPSTKNLYWCSPSGSSKIATKSLWLQKKKKRKENIYTCLKNWLNNNVWSSVHYGGSHRGKASAQIPFIQRDLAAPVVEGACDVNLFPSSSPADHGGSSLRTRLHHVI